MAEDEHRIRIALELNALHWAGAFGEDLEGASIGIGTPIYDLNGTLLYERIPLTGEGLVGYADVAVHPAIGGVLMAVSHGLTWDERALLEQAHRALRKRLPAGARRPDTTRFVAYSYPKIAVQFLAGGDEQVMLELYSWEPVPPQRDRAPDEPPSFFDRWSFLDDQPREVLDRRRERFEARVREIDSIPRRDQLALDRIARSQFADLVDAAQGQGDGGGAVAGGGGGVVAGGGGQGGPLSQRELHFSTRTAGHATCYEVLGQATPVWCVAASVQMLLDFYRYEYTQERVAKALGLGTHGKPKGLSPGDEGTVVEVLETLSSHALDVTMLKDPTWNDFRDEVIGNRPVISFIPSHSRTIAGYVDTGPVTSQLGPFLGLLVYDPWPPDDGVVTRWENSDVQIYKLAFLARLRLG